jgi:hypothetical protein
MAGSHLHGGQGGDPVVSAAAGVLRRAMLLEVTATFPLLRKQENTVQE